jgi:protein-glutamine gamma-glutamyltransferase
VGLRPQLAKAAPEIEKLFQFSLFLLIVTGFVALVSTGKLDVLSVLFVSAALFVRAYDLIAQRNFHVPERWTTYIGLVYVLVYVADFFMISGSFVTATVHLVLFGMVVKIFSVVRERDHVYLATLAFLEVLSAAILTIDTVFLGAFTAFSLIAVVTFIAMEMRRSSAAAVNSAPLPIPASRHGRRRTSFTLFGLAISRMATAIVLGMLIAASGIFFALPRLSYGYLSKLAQQDSLVSGFSDNVNLGEIGRIQQSSQTVAHIKIDNDPNGIYGQRLYLRGAALTKFDGLRWQNPPHDTESMPFGFGGHFPLVGRKTPLSSIIERFAFNPAHNVVHYRVEMEPIGTNVIFLLSQPRYLIGRFREITVDIDESVVNTDRDRIVADYGGVSDLSTPTDTELKTLNGPVPSELTDRYLKVPALDRRIDQLAHSLTDKYSSPFEKAGAIQNYLTTQFAYTLELPSSTPEDPVADFLFRRKQGHCEYFASSMALMLRDVGIPSRVITGFRGGEFNQLTGSYILRARDAHAWVEAYIPDAGWVTFDPTPASSAPVMTSARRFALYLDAAREFWREWIINYDSGHQQQLTQKTVSSTRDRLRDLRIWGEARYRHLLSLARLAHRMATREPRKLATQIVFVLAGLILLFNLARLVRMIRRRMVARNPRSAPQSAASIWYERMSRSAAKAGYRREPAQTPQEFVASIKDEPMRAAVARFTDRYESARFNNSAEDAAELPQLFEEIESKK